MNPKAILRSASVVLAAYLVAGAASAQHTTSDSSGEPPSDRANPHAETAWKSQSSSKPIVVATLATLGAASWGAATYFWYDSYSKGQDADDIWGSRPSNFCRPGETWENCHSAQVAFQAKQNDQDAAADRAWRFYGAGLLLVVGAVATEILWNDAPSSKQSHEKQSREPSAQLGIGLTQSGAILGVSHAF